MEIVKPAIRIFDPINGEEILNKLEFAARVCYQTNEDKKTSRDDLLRRIIKSGHMSVLEHVTLSTVYVGDRAMLNELVRHRIASYSQESTRYCDYGKKGLQFIYPIEFKEPNSKVFNENMYAAWIKACKHSEEDYNNMKDLGAKAGFARHGLNLSLKSQIFSSMNLRGYRNYFTLRCAKAAHLHIREVAIPLLMFFRDAIPIVFDDIPYDKEFFKDYLNNIAVITLWNGTECTLVCDDDGKVMSRSFKTSGPDKISLPIDMVETNNASIYHYSHGEDYDPEMAAKADFISIKRLEKYARDKTPIGQMVCDIDTLIQHFIDNNPQLMSMYKDTYGGLPVYRIKSTRDMLNPHFNEFAFEREVVGIVDMINKDEARVKIFRDDNGNPLIPLNTHMRLTTDIKIKKAGKYYTEENCVDLYFVIRYINNTYFDEVDFSTNVNKNETNKKNVKPVRLDNVDTKANNVNNTVDTHDTLSSPCESHCNIFDRDRDTISKIINNIPDDVDYKDMIYRLIFQASCSDIIENIGIVMIEELYRYCENKPFSIQYRGSGIVTFYSGLKMSYSLLIAIFSIDQKLENHEALSDIENALVHNFPRKFFEDFISCMSK